MEKYDIYLFDFDGTLFNSFNSLYYVFKNAYGAVGVEIEEKDVPWLSRVPLEESYRFYNAPYDEEHIDIFAKALHAGLDDPNILAKTEMFPDTEEFFKLAKENNLFLGVVTSNKEKHIYEVLDFFLIPHNVFKVVVGNEKAPKTKPDPMPVIKSLEEIGYKGPLDKVVYIGDSFNDCLSAKNAGVKYYLIDRKNEYNGDEFPVIHSLLEIFK